MNMNMDMNMDDDGMQVNHLLVRLDQNLKPILIPNPSGPPPLSGCLMVPDFGGDRPGIHGLTVTRPLGLLFLFGLLLLCGGELLGLL